MRDEACAACRWTRREWLAGVGAVALVGCGAAEPGGDAGAPDDARAPGSDAGEVLSCGEPVEAPNPRWTRVELAEHPALREPGGTARIDDDAALLHVVALRTSASCVLAVFRVCPHGACEVAWEPATSVWRCPCHGSRFAPEGTLLEGPADRGLRQFPAVVDGDAVWIKGPRG